MKNFSIIAIRDFDLDGCFGWRGSYFLDPCETLESAIELAIKERTERGGKYGFVIYKNGAEVGAINFGSVGGFVPRSEY